MSRPTKKAQGQPKYPPLAAILRPSRLTDIIGQEHLLDEHRPIHRMASKKRVMNTILWGPPGTGKTTLAMALSKEIDARFRNINATDTSIKEIRAIIDEAASDNTQQTVLFVDECLPYNTLVYCLRDNKEDFIPIGYIVEMKIDCKVLSVNLETNKAEWCDITHFSVSPPKAMVEIEIEGKVLRCSEDHLIYTSNRGYVSAVDLTLDDDVCLLQNYLQEAHNAAKRM
jgi:hypothetical protein